MFEIAFGLNAAGVVWRDLRNRAVGDLTAAGNELINKKLIAFHECSPESDAVVERKLELDNSIESLTFWTTTARLICFFLAFVSAFALLLIGYKPDSVFYDGGLFAIAFLCLATMPLFLILLDILGTRKLRKMQDNCKIALQGVEAKNSKIRPKIPPISE